MLSDQPSEQVCPNCGEPGDPRHHWLDQQGVFEGYVCFGKDSNDEQRAKDDRYGDDVMAVMASHLPVDDMGTARDLLDTLRSLPVEERMEAMGMRPVEATRIWVDVPLRQLDEPIWVENR